MAGISREERERRRLAAEAAAASPDNSQTWGQVDNPPEWKERPLESRHWPGLFYDPSDPEPQQNNMLGTQDPVWSAWFERNGGKLK